MTSIYSIHEFTIYTERLKRELRNSWLSDGRRESVADHSWRMAIMAIFLGPMTGLKLDLEKVLKMALIHDLAEIKIGDIPTIDQNAEVVAQKYIDEDEAFREISSMLGGDQGGGLYELWQEFRDQETSEARFVKAIDKLECVIQKNQQSTDINPGASGYFTKLAELCDADPVLKDFYGIVIGDVRKRDGITPEQLAEL